MTLRQFIRSDRSIHFVVAGLAVLILTLILAYIFFLGTNGEAETSSYRETTVSLEELGIFPLPPVRSPAEESRITFGDFVGAEACRECHEDEYNLWRRSTHGKAGGEPSPERIIGRFDRIPLQFRDAEVVPSVTAEGEYRFTVRQTGLPEKVLKVDAVIGGGHIVGGGTQSYFSKFSDGTLRMLPFDFIRDENIWFVQLRERDLWTPVGREISLSDLTHWPPFRILGTHSDFSNCQNCHGTQLLVEYDSAAAKIETRFATLAINCESCHGPGKRHVELALSESLRAEDIGLPSLSALGKDGSLNVCFQCHAVKDALRDGYLPGMELESYYSLKLPILGNNPYLPDGRVASFAYQQNHLFSDCYLSGSMTCVDCHDPHSQGYRDISGNALNGRFDNGQCTGCHAGKRVSPEDHSHHVPDSPASRCTSCHMPFLQHRGIGKQLKFARADHTISIPRPKFDAMLGIHNACAQCHADKSADWLQVKVEAWYGELKPHNMGVEGILKVKTGHSRIEAAELLLHHDSQHPGAQVTGLVLFVKNFLSPDVTSMEPEIIEELKMLSTSGDLDVKALSLATLHYCCGADLSIRQFLEEKLRSAAADEVSLRSRWTIALDDLGSLHLAMEETDFAITVHRKALEVSLDDPTAWLHLGNDFAHERRWNVAEACYRKALKIKETDVVAYIQLARALMAQGNRSAASSAVRDALRYDPGNSDARQLLEASEKPN